jgi:hypothetical protein
MAIRVAVFICVTSFLLGILFTHWIADSLTLWKINKTDERLWTAASYYHILVNGHPAFGYALLTAVITGGVCILLNLLDGQAYNLMFDGGSSCAYGFATFTSIHPVETI